MIIMDILLKSFFENKQKIFPKLYVIAEQFVISYCFCSKMEEMQFFS